MTDAMMSVKVISQTDPASRWTSELRLLLARCAEGGIVENGEILFMHLHQPLGGKADHLPQDIGVSPWRPRVLRL